MRIIAGKFRHRQIAMTGLSTTRETQDSVREAIFNMIGPYFDGGSALDLFAGSGALGLEAYSRGVAEIYLNDINLKATDICRQNALSLKIPAKISNLDYEVFLKKCDRKFDLIFLDPPYSMTDVDKILSLVYPFLNSEGLIVFEMAKSTVYKLFENLKVLKERIYGIKKVVIFTGGYKLEKYEG